MALGVGLEPPKTPTLAPTLGGAFGAAPGLTGGAVGAMSPSMNDYGTLWSLYQGANLPQQVSADTQIANLQNRLGISNAQADNSRTQINQAAGFDRERLGMQRGSLQDQLADTGAQRKDIDYWHQRQSENFMGGQAARGATHTLGTTRGLQDFETERARLLRGLGMGEKQLARTSKNLGIQEQELESRVSGALRQIGLDQAINVSDVFDAIADIEAGRFNPMSQILGDVYRLSGIRPVAQSTPTATSGGGGGKKVQ